MTDEIAERLLRIAANASNESTEEEQDFVSLVASTRRSFRRNNVLSPRRGRKRKMSFNKIVILMKLAHADFYPCNSELKFLRDRGLGQSEEMLSIRRDNTLEEIKEEIVLLFRPHIQNLLRMCGFKLAKLEKCKKITHLENIQDGSDLEIKLKQSKLIVLPLNDFPNDLPLVEVRNNSVSQARNSTQSIPSTSSIPNHNDFSNSELRSEQITSNSVTVSQAIEINPRSRNERVQLLRNAEEPEEDINISDDEQFVHETVDNVELSLMMPCLPEGTEKITVHISRNNCFYDLINLYMDEQTMNKNLHVIFLGEMGIDSGGLTKELFNIFFVKCEGTFFQGEDCLVPYLELNKLHEQDKFIIIGRILQHMLLLTSTIPSKLSRITLMLIGNPEKDIDSNILLQELLNYVNPYLRKIFKKAQKNFISLSEKEKDTIQDFYQTNRFFARPSAELILEQLNIIATEILIEKPKRLIAKIRQGVSPEKNANFWNHCDFNVLLDMQTPTATKVVNCLSTDSYLTNEESDVFHYFTMYIHCLDRDKLATLVFLITGSFLMPACINVKFNDSVGLSQRPLFSTCTDTITLPKTYANYNDLKNDLNICLTTEEAKEYTSY